MEEQDGGCGHTLDGGVTKTLSEDLVRLMEYLYIEQAKRSIRTLKSACSEAQGTLSIHACRMSRSPFRRDGSRHVTAMSLVGDSKHRLRLPPGALRAS
jgi:hypothetical protein